MSEAFFVPSEPVLLYDGHVWAEAGPGDLLHVPPGGVHAFRKPNGPASMLMLFTPGGRARPASKSWPRFDDAARLRMSAADWPSLYVRHDQIEATGSPPPR